MDNAGFELCTDLLLADHLLTSGAAAVVRLRVKHHPTFVSDVLEADVDGTSDALAADGGRHPAAAAAAARWRGRRTDGSLVCRAEPYWAMPYPLWEMPADIRADLAATSDLVIIKGDANYRRALGDRPWPLDARFDDVVSYAPAPLLALRTLKAELGCGMPKAKTDAAAAADPTWLTDGAWGVIQLAPAHRPL